MRQLTTIAFFLVLTQLFSIEKKYDWFEMNLKGNPTYIKETSIFPLNYFSEPELSFLIDSSLRSNLKIEEYYFDSVGQINRRILINSDGHFDSDSSVYTTKRREFQDSIIIDSYFGQTKSPHIVNRYYYDEKGYLKEKQVSGGYYWHWEYKRDSKNQIDTIYEKSTMIDTSSDSQTYYRRNKNGDIIQKEVIGKLKSALQEGYETRNRIEEYKYLYDELGNWIYRITFSENKIQLITERKIKYE